MGVPTVPTAPVVTPWLILGPASRHNFRCYNGSVLVKRFEGMIRQKKTQGMYIPLEESLLLLLLTLLTLLTLLLLERERRFLFFLWLFFS